MDNEVFLTCGAEFSASHHYRVRGWSDEENLREFGKAANPKGHGHNYRVEVTVKGSVNPKTGMLINIKELKKMLKDLLESLDHKNLNEDVPCFKETLPTTENLACHIFGELSGRVPAGKVDRVRVYENESLYAEYRGEQVPA